MLKRPPGMDEEHIRAAERQAAEKWLCERLEAWLAESPRRPAATAFTAGPLRNLARSIEAVEAAARMGANSHSRTDPGNGAG